MSFRYIGSKARIVDAIMEHVGTPDGGVFVDAFSGRSEHARGVQGFRLVAHLFARAADHIILDVFSLPRSSRANEVVCI